ncbi:hypothetical protein ACHHYP_08188 [Achlya hypogyna]|uniref:TM7S3/TM198-like domain-containing protein n=1 Tax=Achlya hypogyna TaxID=1202772 RepID=A0A1V9YPP3_ACHHY|nr:hypothetical protein ACHHYP_08188 [Achlya hypogyna]
MSPYSPYMRFVGFLAVLLLAASVPLAFFGYRFLPYTARLCTFLFVLLITVQCVLAFSSDDSYDPNMNIIGIVLAVAAVGITWKLPTVTTFSVGALAGASIVLEVFDYAIVADVWALIVALVAGAIVGVLCNCRRVPLIVCMAFNGAMVLMMAVSFLILTISDNFVVIYYGAHAAIFAIAMVVQFKLTAVGIDHHTISTNDVATAKTAMSTPAAYDNL